jgi:hypothetical protein
MPLSCESINHNADKVLALFVLHLEGERAREALEQASQVADRIMVIHDGPIDTATRSLCNEYLAEIIEADPAGCKEPHLARFFASYNGKYSWILHLDSDEVISKDLVEELKALPLGPPCVFWGQLLHQRKNGKIVRYARRSFARGLKPVLFHVDSIKRIIGIPHRGIIYTGQSRFLEFPVMHLAEHLDYSLRQLFNKEMRFCAVEAKHRTRPVLVCENKSLSKWLPDSIKLSATDRLRYKFPLILLPLCLLFRIHQSALWFCGVRSLEAVKEELSLFLTRLPYQAKLLLLISQYKVDQGEKAEL